MPARLPAGRQGFSKVVSCEIFIHSVSKDNLYSFLKTKLVPQTFLFVSHGTSASWRISQRFSKVVIFAIFWRVLRKNLTLIILKLARFLPIGFVSGIMGSNHQPHGPKPCALANCANPRLGTNLAVFPNDFPNR